MSKKARKKGNPASRAQQQQAAAQRRSILVTTGRERGIQQPVTAVPDHIPARPDRVIHDYLDVSVVRIQEWLSRTPDLKFRRGASVLLTEATARDSGPSLPPGLAWNEEAGSLDAVVSLIVDDVIGPADVAACLLEGARCVARQIRDKMPYCHIQAVTGQGESYALAYPGMIRARREGAFLVDAPSAPPEVILAKPCDQCRSAAATYRDIVILASEPHRDLCRDCHERFQAAGGTRGSGLRRSPLPERRMKVALAEAGLTVAGFADDFASMAAAGRRDRDDAATQLALIFADGNRVGAFLGAAAKQAGPGPGPDKASIVPVLTGATLGALADAVIDRFPGWSHPPVLANLAGGDDLLISVPAPDAWLFVRTLLTSFGRRLGVATKGWPQQVRRRVPSLSAGLVFHHKMDPFSDLVRLASDQLHRAKQAGQGQQATVSFLDLTADGDQPPPDRKVLTVADLDLYAEQLRQIEAIPAARRATLIALHRQKDMSEFTRRLADFDNGPLWEVAAGRPGAGAADARHGLIDHPGRADDLRRLLDIARHWHTEARPEDNLEARAGKAATR